MEFDKIEKDFKYTREYMGLIQDIGLLDTEEFANTKEDQEVTSEKYWIRVAAGMFSSSQTDQPLPILDQPVLER